MTKLWPDLPATLFGPDTRFPRLNADVAFVHQRQGVFAYREGYRRGATLLGAGLRATADSPELLLWPVAWLWRHYLELALKETIARGEMLLDESAQWTWPHGHKLAALWTKAVPHIEPHGAAGAPEVANVAAIIGEFDSLDPDATGFRYITNVRGQPSLGTAPTHINVGLLDETMQRVATFLDAVRSCQEEALDALLAQARDARGEW